MVPLVAPIRALGLISASLNPNGMAWQTQSELFQSQAPVGDAPRDDSVIPSAAPNVPAAGADMSKFPPCSATPVSGA